MKIVGAENRYRHRSGNSTGVWPSSRRQSEGQLPARAPGGPAGRRRSGAAAGVVVAMDRSIRGRALSGPWLAGPTAETGKPFAGRGRSPPGARRNGTIFAALAVRAAVGARLSPCSRPRTRRTKEQTDDSMPKSFDDQVVLVTGGSTGIGAAVALQLAQAGAKVVITGRHEADAARVGRPPPGDLLRRGGHRRAGRRRAQPGRGAHALRPPGRPDQQRRHPGDGGPGRCLARARASHVRRPTWRG